LYWAGATLFSLNVNRRDRGAARAEAERLWRIADRAGDPAMIAAASRRIGYLQHLAGEFREAQRSIERALRFRFLMDDQQPAFWSFPFHHVSDARATLSEILLMRGFAERAFHEARSNLDELNARDRLTSVHGLLAWGTCRIAVLTGDLITADQEIRGLIELSARMGAPFWRVRGRLLEGKVMVGRRAFADALRTLRGAFDISHETLRFVPDEEEVAGTFAEALAGVGRFDEALAAVADAIIAASRPDAVAWCLSELLRVKGEVLLRRASDGSIPAAEDCFSQAAEVAHKQGALFWELRIALSVARLRVAQRRENEAREILQPVYDRFTEGFGMTDLRAAKALIDELSG
jgi:tetratricopeptide (TPR) repeat protein